MPGRNWRATDAKRRIHTPKGGAQPARMNSHASALAARCHKGPQEATPRTRPPAPPPLGRRPQAGRQRHATEDFSSCTLSQEDPFENPRGPLRGGTAGQHHPALWAFCTPMRETAQYPPKRERRLKHWPPASTMDTHSGGMSRVAQLILGPHQRREPLGVYKPRGGQAGADVSEAERSKRRGRRVGGRRPRRRMEGSPPLTPPQLAGGRDATDFTRKSSQRRAQPRAGKRPAGWQPAGTKDRVPGQRNSNHPRQY